VNIAHHNDDNALFQFSLSKVLVVATKYSTKSGLPKKCSKTGLRILPNYDVMILILVKTLGSGSTD